MKRPPKRPPTKLPTGWLVVSAAFGFTLTWTYVSYRRALTHPLPSDSDREALDLIGVWKGKRVLEIDDGRDWDERVAGILARRKKLVAFAKGDVLESAAGTGKNSLFYDPERVRSVTMVDVAPDLLEAARVKWREEEKFTHLRDKIVMRFLVGDLGRKGVEASLRPIQSSSEKQEEERPQRRFDTVIQTMGLCSTKDPVELLKNLGQVVKPDGRILLLEHGMGYYSWLNDLLDHTAWDHAKKHGCWWNRDIKQIVDESGLEVEEMKRYNLGTTWWLILKPNKSNDGIAVKPTERNSIEVPSDLKRSWFQSWTRW
jgi:methyltransferase OMS1, mitochondrial